MSAIVPVRNFENLIYEFRGIKVMLDFDLAMLYGTETKRLKEQVKRNSARFPGDFMFQLTKEENESLRSQFATLKRGQHSKYLPYAFTEQGVAMLSGVLSSPKAIQINIEIMRAFSRYRAFMLDNKELKKEIMALDDKMNKGFRILVQRIDELAPTIRKRRKIGYSIKRK